MSNNDEEFPDGDIDFPKRENENSAHGTSAKQVAANRRNALHSTGPLTQEGKLASKFNATKHGLRATEVVIPGREDPTEFEALLKELCDDWMPEGRTQMSLVEEIAIDQWRLRRVHRAELCESRKGMMDAATSDPSEAVYQKNPDIPVPQLLRKTSFGIADLKSTVEEVMRELEVEGTVSWATCDLLNQRFGKSEDNPAPVLGFWFLGQKRQLVPKSALSARTAADKKVAARAHLETCLADLELRRRELERQESLAREIELQRLGIPDGPKVELISRYETGIKRNMYRAMDQLERLQRRRKGEPPPPTVNVNLSNNDGD